MKGSGEVVAAEGAGGGSDRWARQLLAAAEHSIDQAEFNGLFGSEIAHPIGILGQLFNASPRVVRQDFQHGTLVLKHFLGTDLDVCGLAARTAPGLVQHDRGMGQRSPLAFGAGRENYRGGAHGLANADGVHRGLDVAEGVADGEGFGFKADRVAGVPAGARGVDIEVDRLLGVVELEIEKLGDDQFGDIEAELTLGVVIREQGQTEVDDPFLEHQRRQVRRWRPQHRGVSVVRS